MKSFYHSFLKIVNSKNLLLTIFTSFLFAGNLSAQIIPTAGETECFVAANGGIFVDHGGTVDNPVAGPSDQPGEYLNCACETATTLCSPDGSAITVDFTEFVVFATFDYLEIYDGDSNLGNLLFSNATGGPNAGDQDLVDMIASNGGTNFTGTTGCLTFVFFATGVVSDPGWSADITVASGATHPGDNLPCGTNLDCPAPANIAINNITNVSADITWMVVDSADTYNIEWGEDGFTPGTGNGTVVNTTDLMLPLTGLTQNTAYQFYIQSDCGGGETSNLAGPFSFVTALSCPAPTDVSVDAVGVDFADISWTPSFAALSYTVEYGLPGFTPGTGLGATINTANTSVTISGLFENTNYEFYVNSNCDNEVSNNATPNTFTTIIEEPCEYTLELFDSFGDGWNGSILTATVGCISTDYTFTTGNEAVFTVIAGANLPLTFTYTAGAFQNEVSYHILDPAGDTILADGPFPITGVVLETFGCPTCEGPTDVTVDAVKGDGADVSWAGSPTATSYKLEYGPTGFLPGTGIVLNTTNTFATIEGLDELSPYDFYATASCMNGDSSGLGCPISFTTIRLDDVGIISINSPESQCGLGEMETISVTMQNFGSNPQSLVPFFYSVNGVVAPVNIPLDGFYTNVIGQDSIENLVFTTAWDFSQPGTYEIAAWTELDGDSNMVNDTAYFTVTNIPIISDVPYEQNFEDDNGGWMVDLDASANGSWAFGEPAGTDIPNAADGVNAWVTNLNGNYNNNELSYLVSNCFDFTNVNDNPTISFSINYDTETNFDGCWLELSIDGGQNWVKAGILGSGVNWYNFNNTSQGLGDVWAGNSGGWITAKNLLGGVAGQSDVRLRFVFDSDPSVNGFEGIGIDDVAIFLPVANDMLAQSVVNSSALECGDPNDELTITIVNNGTATQSGFDVGYQINNDPPVIENVGTLSLAPDEIGTYTFTTPFSSTGTGIYTVTAWTDLAGELNITNDTTVYEFATFRLLPFREDFEGGSLPDGWSSDEFNPVTDAHNNISFVAFDNLYSFDPTFELVSPPVGPIETGDSLFFDYRYVDFTGGGANATTLGEGDTLEVQVSTDCGMTYTTIFNVNQDNHITSNQLATISLGLDSYAGEALKFRFLGTWGTGDYYLDIDNINVFQCTTLDLLTSSTAELDTNADGTASVTANGGVAPYTYLWDNGDVTSTITGLELGEYAVTVTDALGCTDEATVTVDMEVNTIEVNEIQSLQLYPNPTTSSAMLDMEFSQTVEVKVEMINMMGQIIFETASFKTNQEQLELDLQKYPDGMYFVRVKVNEQSVVKKLMKSRP
ncbi:MAG: fibronectin type III domain-containing protein [Bacteroidota bacterium]